jgi:hypothetical protein
MSTKTLEMMKLGVQIPQRPLRVTLRGQQHTGFHLLHALWGPWFVSWQEDASGNTDVDFVYIPVGAIVGIANTMRASNANKAHLEMLNSNEIWNKEIKPGEVVYGVVTIPAMGIEEFGFRFRG